MSLVSELVTELKVKDSGFSTGIKAAMGAITAMAGAGAALYASIDTITSRIDDMTKSAERLGVSRQAFESLAYAANISNVSVDSLQIGMRRLAVAVDAAEQGSDEAASTFKRLGVSTKELMSLSLDKQYALIADAINNVKNKNEQLAIAQKLFGRNGSEQLSLIRDGVSGLMSEYDKLGLSISDSQAEAADAFQDSKTRLLGIFSGFTAQVGAEVAPAFTILTDGLAQALTGTGSLREASQALSSVLISVVQVGVNGFDIFLTVLDSVRDRIDQIITGVGNAMQRIGMVKEFLVNAASGAGFSTDPGMIGKLNQTENAPASGLGGGMSTIQQRLADLQTKLLTGGGDSSIPSIGGMAGRSSGPTVSEMGSISVGKAGSGLESMVGAGLGTSNKPLKLDITVKTSDGFNLSIASSKEIEASVQQFIQGTMANEAAGMK